MTPAIVKCYFKRAEQGRRTDSPKFCSLDKKVLSCLFRLSG